MKEIKLIVSDEKFKQNRKNALLKEAARKNYKEQEMIKRVSIGIVLGLIMIWFLGLLIMFDIKLKEQGYNGCIENGYSEAYCLKHS